MPTRLAASALSSGTGRSCSFEGVDGLLDSVTLISKFGDDCLQIHERHCSAASGFPYVRERRRRHDLPLDLEADSQPDAKLFDLAVLNPATLFRDLKPLHVANCLPCFGDSVLPRFRKAYGRCSDQLGDFVYSG